MPLSNEDRQLLKEIFQRLEDRPLEPGTPRYEQLYQPIYEVPGCEDPVELLQRYVEFSGVESLQLFSGFRGSGKSTELLRLKHQLEGNGYVVLYSDAVKYINPSEEIEISDLAPRRGARPLRGGAAALPPGRRRARRGQLHQPARRHRAGAR